MTDFEKVNVVSSIKCNCPICNGTGLMGKIDDCGIICNNCLGTGYHFEKLGYDEELVQDKETGYYYGSRYGSISRSIDIFRGKRILPYLYHVTFMNHFTSPNHISSFISYDAFLNGDFPVPEAEYGCPNEFLLDYVGASFNEECLTCLDLNGCQSCSEYINNQKCWQNFYKEENPQAVLSRLKRNS